MTATSGEQGSSGPRPGADAPARGSAGGEPPGVGRPSSGHHGRPAQPSPHAGQVEQCGRKCESEISRIVTLASLLQAHARESLTSGFRRVVKTMRGEARLTEANTQEMLREIRIALLEADVALPVVRDFVAQGPRKARWARRCCTA